MNGSTRYHNMGGGNNNNVLRLSQLLHNPNPVPMPDWLCPSCSMKLISQYWRTYTRDLQREYSNRQIRSFLADPCRLRTMGSSTGTSLQYGSYGGGAWTSKSTGTAAVQLGVLQPRVEMNGRPCPQTLDLFGLAGTSSSKKPLMDRRGTTGGGGGDAVKTAVIDLDPDCAEDGDGSSSSSRKNKKAKLIA